MTASKPLYAYLSAAALALVTIFTFYVFRDFGPQSVLRRFHIDAAVGDDLDISRITVRPGPQIIIHPGAAKSGPADLQDLATQYMKGVVREYIRANAGYEIGAMKRSHNEVLAAVEYVLPDGKADAVGWHVVQGPNDWRIDCLATARNYQGFQIQLAQLGAELPNSP